MINLKIISSFCLDLHWNRTNKCNADNWLQSSRLKHENNRKGYVSNDDGNNQNSNHNNNHKHGYDINLEISINLKYHELQLASMKCSNVL